MTDAHPVPGPRGREPARAVEIHIGCDVLSVRGYDPLQDARDREVLPLVGAELARRTMAVPA